MFLRIFAATLLCAAPAWTLRVCPEGSVGVGVGQFLHIGDPIGGPFEDGQTGEIYANDCGIIAGSTDFNDGFCVESWSNNAGVTCDSNGVPTLVHTEGGDFGNCVDATQFGNTDCSLAPLTEFFVHFCCSRL